MNNFIVYVDKDGKLQAVEREFTDSQLKRIKSESKTILGYPYCKTAAEAKSWCEDYV